MAALKWKWSSRFVVVGFASLLITGCPRDETPVKLYICDENHENCFLAARFKTMDGCKSHERWAGMLCDSVSQPGKMICTEVPDHETAARSYCQK
jgi:hypothetical protein